MITANGLVINAQNGHNIVTETENNSRIYDEIWSQFVEDSKVDGRNNHMLHLFHGLIRAGMTDEDELVKYGF